MMFVAVRSGPLGSVRNLQVTDPTTSTLNVRWEPPEGNVREYIVIWKPTAGGEQEVVRAAPKTPRCSFLTDMLDK